MGIATAIGRRSTFDCTVFYTSWDAWCKGETAGFGIGTTMIDDPAAKTSITTRYGYRQTLKSDGSAYPGNWYTLLSGDTAGEQAAVDDQCSLLHELGGGNPTPRIVRGFLWYPPPGPSYDGGPFVSSDIYSAGLGYYLTSPNKSLHSFGLVLQSALAARDHNSPGTWLNFATFGAQWAALIADANYGFTSDGRALIGIYQTPGGATQWDAGHITTLRGFVTGAGFPNPFLIYMNGNAADANAIGCDGITIYGPNPVYGAAGQNPYLTASDHDKTFWTTGVSGSLQERCLPCTTKLDTRPRAYTSWFDDPTYTDFLIRLQRDFAMLRSSRGLCQHSISGVYSFNETDEGGGSLPNPIDVLIPAVNTPSRGTILDAYKNVLNGNFRSTYEDAWHCTSIDASFARTGAGWAIVQDLTGGTGGTAGAWKYSELQSTTVTNKVVWTSPVPVTRIRLYGRIFGAGGTFNCHHDAVADTLVNQAGVDATRVLLYDSGALAVGIHSLTWTVVTGCSVNYVLADVSL